MSPTRTHDLTEERPTCLSRPRADDVVKFPLSDDCNQAYAPVGPPIGADMGAFDSDCSPGSEVPSVLSMVRVRAPWSAGGNSFTCAEVDVQRFFVILTVIGVATHLGSSGTSHRGASSTCWRAELAVTRIPAIW